MKRTHILALSLLAGVLALGTAMANAQSQGQYPREENRAKRQDAGGRRSDREVKQRTGHGGGQPRRDREAANVALPPEVAALRPLSIVLGRPTDRAVTLNVLAGDSREGFVEYGTAAGRYGEHSGTVSLPAGTPVEVALGGLEPDTAYFYRLRWRKPGEKDLAAGQEHRFHTQRAPGSTFTFEIQGDSHPERAHQHDPALYAQTLVAAAADRPDFYMTIGDDFSVDTLRTVNAEAVGKIYLNQRLFLALVGHSSPVFLVNGNHEQAAACNLDGTPDNVAVWAQTARNRYFPQPAPDGFYTGDPEPVEFIGLLRDYYAWTWGDALFVVIDPYWHSPKPVDNVFGGGGKSRDMWAITLGDAQYEWLKRTLDESKAKYRFVFAHHVLGTGRGGIEEADLYEWGGKNKRGEWEFDRMRPGWKLPVHQLMVKSGVTIFFQGHDHIFVRQELDGVVYQTLPEPADPNYALYNREAYRTGDALPNSGRVRVTVSPEKVSVDYLRSYLPKDATAEHPDGEVAFHYEIPAPGKLGKQGKTPRTKDRP